MVVAEAGGFDIGASAEQTVASASQSPTTADTLVQ